MGDALTQRIRDSYDAVPYVGGPQYWAHPICLATVGAMLGMSPPDPRNARILEIGCATGGNLLPMATQLPDTELVGIDLSPRQIDVAVELAKTLSLPNVRFEALDIQDADSRLGDFDYILCHGVFSWVPRAVQDSILQLCVDRLTPSGLAYISYNTHPGSQSRELARGVARFGAAEVLEDASVDQVYALWKAVADAMPDSEHVVAQQLTKALSDVEGSDDYYVKHEYLEDVNEPLWFYEFERRVRDFGLQYVGESVRSALATDFPDKTQQAIASMSPTLAASEQLIDLVANTAFRRSIVCHEAVGIPRATAPEAMLHMWAFAAANRVGEGADGAVTFKARAGREFTTNMPVLIAILDRLADAWPASLPVAELVSELTPGGADPTAEVPTDQVEALTAMLAQLWINNAVGLMTSPFRLAAEVSECPSAPSLTRLQAERGMRVTNLLHQVVDVSESARALLPLLDGTRSTVALNMAWAQIVGSVEDADFVSLDEILTRLAKMGLLNA